MEQRSTADSTSSLTFSELGTGLLYGYLTSLIAIFGIYLGYDYLSLTRPSPPGEGSLLGAFAHWDGRWYRKIVVEGYDFHPEQPSKVAFFPAYPLAARLLTTASGCRPDLALLFVSQLCLAGTFVVLAAYARCRLVDAPPHACKFSLLALGLWPTTCFCRFAYSESPFLLIVTLAFYAMFRRWPAWTIALLVGMATATRLVGVAMLVPFLLHIWDVTPSLRRRVLYVALLMPLACWGLAAYMAYLGWAFGAPLAFAQTQQHWRARPPALATEKLTALLTLEPVWSVYTPGSACGPVQARTEPSPVFSLHFANPVYFVAALWLVMLGWRKGWLTGGEVGFALALLGIAYCGRSYEMCMAGMGRFVATVLPMYLVLGRLLALASPPVAAALLALSGFFLGAYSALFAARYPII